MAYVSIDNFKLGQDNRTPAIAGEPGSLVLLKNGHITSGKYIRRAKKFVAKYVLPTASVGTRITDATDTRITDAGDTRVVSENPGETFGLHSQGGNLFVFGGFLEPSGIPSGVTYQRLAHKNNPTSSQVSKILSTENFDGKIYAIVEYDDSAVYHFYDGNRVVSWDAIADAVGSNNTVADTLKNKIDLNSLFDATVSTNTVTIEAATADLAFTISATAQNFGTVNDQLITLVQIAVAAPGVKEKWTAAVSGTFEGVDFFTITLNSVDYTASGASTGTGRTALTFKSKLYSTVASLLYFSALNAPTQFGTGIGSGFINLANQDSGSETLNGVEIFQNSLAVMSDGVTQIQFVDEDEDLNALIHTVRNTGSSAPRSLVQFGNTDLFYLDSSQGIRSIRARDSSGAPQSDDVGSPIDPHILAYLETLTDTQIANAIGLIANEEQYWLAVGSRIYVFSFSSAAKVSAWSYYEPGFEIEQMVRAGTKVYLRNGNDIYLYGGDDGTTYPDAATSVVTVTLPFLDLDKAAHQKTLEAFDIGSLNTWDISILTDPDDLNVKSTEFTLSNTTYTDARKGGLSLRSSHFAPTLSCSAAGNAELYSLAIHYQLDEAA